MAAPKVSVSIPTYNRADTLGQAISSVLEQDYHDFELIISDNASTDYTKDLVNSFKDARIRYIRNENNIGMNENFNQCLNLSRGDYCAFLGSDDYWLQDFLKNMVEVLDANPDVAIGFTNHFFLQGGELIPREKLIRPGLHEDCISKILKRNPICLTASLIRKAVFDDVGPFSCAVLPADFDFYLRVARSRHKIYYMDRLLAVYRLHDNNESRNWGKIAEGAIEILHSVRFSSLKDEMMRRKILSIFLRHIGFAQLQVNILATARSYFKQSLRIWPFSILALSGLIVTYLPHNLSLKVFLFLKVLYRICRGVFSR